MVNLIEHGSNLGSLAERVGDRLQQIERENVVRRLWDGDHTIWKPDPAEISDRLGWLTVIDTMLDRTDELRSFAEGIADDGYEKAMLLGMGGSSLAPEVLQHTFRAQMGSLDLRVLDTTDPAAIRAVEDEIGPDKTLFIVASKSGTTVETMSHLAYFWAKQPEGEHFVAITDPGTPLAALARERDFRRVFENPPDIGGRYSALSYFGLVPGALIGVDLKELLSSARDLARECRSPAASENAGAWLGAVLGEGALAGRDKLTLLLPEALASLGYWLEQLIAESTGKEGRGIVPIEGEPLGPPDVYGKDRLFIAIGEHDGLDALERAGHPVVRLHYAGPEQLGGEFFRWEFATAIAGHVLAINPFDQPNVQEAKDATARILKSRPAELETEQLDSLLEQVAPGDYIAIQAYLPRNNETEAALAAARLRLRDRYHVATTAGYGPRYLHSTGQLHKGGPETGVFVQIVGDDHDDLAVPGAPYTFGTLKRAQAQGDLQALQSRELRVARTSLDKLQEV